MVDLLTLAVLATQGEHFDGLSAQQALTASLTAEGLLFAAYSVAFALATNKRNGGRSIFFSQAWLGWLILIALLLAASSGVGAWVDLNSGEWPDTRTQKVQSYGLLSVLVAQPVLVLIINLEARR